MMAWIIGLIVLAVVWAVLADKIRQARIDNIKGIANAHALLLSLGTMFVGIGEWINHPLQTAFVRPSINAPTGGIISGHPRSPSVFGNVFDIAGLALLAVAIFKIAAAA